MPPNNPDEGQPRPPPRLRPPLPPSILRLARAMRGEATDAETRLWRCLRDRQMAGVKFRRQHLLGRFILDFYCHAAKLAIELDGGGHDEPAQRSHDTNRGRWLEGQGIRVLRFWNTDVLQNLQGVLGEIYDALLAAGPSPQPSPDGRGGRQGSAERG